MQLDGLFLDLYGTLTDGDRAAVESVCADVVADYDMRLTAHELSIAWGDRFFAEVEVANDEAFLTLFDLEIKTLVEVTQAHGVTVEPLSYVKKLESYWMRPPLQPEVRDFFGALRHPVCIVSNADRKDAESALTSHGIEVAAIVTSEDARSYKPASKIFDLALEKTGWARERVMHVGDSLHSDVGGAHRAGIRSGWVKRSQRIYDVGEHRPHHEFEDLRALAEHLLVHHSA